MIEPLYLESNPAQLHEHTKREKVASPIRRN